MAELHFNYGAMNSGKTIDVLRSAHNYDERGLSPFIVKPKSDTKGEDKIVSRIGIERTVDLLAPPDMNIRDVIASKVGKSSIDCVFADEAQFFTPAQIDQLFELTLEPLDIQVRAYGLRGDFRTQGFPGSTRLLEVAHVIQEIRTICRCGSAAIFNGRQVNGDFTSSGEQVAIDGEARVAYESLCGACYRTNVGSVSSERP